MALTELTVANVDQHVGAGLLLASTVVSVDGVLLFTASDDVIVEFAPILSVAFRVDEDHVVAGMSAAAVHQHRVQSVISRRRLRFQKKLVQM